MPLFSRDGIERSSWKAIRRDDDKHWGRTDGSGDSSTRVDEEGLDLDALLKKHLLCTEAGDSDDVTEESRVAARSPITAAGHKVPMFRKGYVNLLSRFGTEVKTARHESEAASLELEDQKPSAGELQPSVQLLTGNAEKLKICRNGCLPRRLS